LPKKITLVRSLFGDAATGSFDRRACACGRADTPEDDLAMNLARQDNLRREHMLRDEIGLDSVDRSISSTGRRAISERRISKLRALVIDLKPRLGKRRCNGI
jgi:hypothetical protein